MDKESTATNDGPIGLLGARLAYNNARGAVAGLSYVSDQVFGRPQHLALSAEASQNERRVNLSFGMDRLSDHGPNIGFSLYRIDTKASSTFDFDTLSYGVKPKFTKDISDTQRISFSLDLSNDTISGVKSSGSALIQKDQGQRRKASFGVEYGLSNESTALQFNLSYNALSTGGSFVKSEGSYGQSATLADGAVVVQSKLMAGNLAMSGGTSSIGDRFFFGQTLVRGFDYAGIGPRDLAAGKAALGGNSYAGGKVDVMFPKLVRDQDVFVPGLFADIGSVWGLDGAGVDDGRYLRQSAGVSMRFQFGKASANIYLSKPLNAQSYDQQSNLQLSLETRF